MHGQRIGPGRRSRPRRNAVLLVVVLVAVAGAVLVWPPPFAHSWFADERPAAVAGAELPPVAGTPEVRIAAAGDTGTGDAVQLATARRMHQHARGDPYDALLLLGDLIYEDGDAALVDRMITGPFAPLVRDGAELLAVLGNHDYRSGEQQQILTALGRSSPWYVETVGSVRVVALDSNRVEDAEQTRWLQETLAAPASPGTWVVVAMHHPPYSAGHHGSDMEVRRMWERLFTRHDVPLVLAGHDHDYQWSEAQQGVTYVVSGAGAKSRPAGSEDFTAVSTDTLHFLDLLFYDDRLTVRAVDQAGRLVDDFALTR